VERNELHDWSAYLLTVDKELRHINDKLLHKNYDVLPHIVQIKEALDKTLVWVAENSEQ
jgi:hypothetical protein